MKQHENSGKKTRLILVCLVALIIVASGLAYYISGLKYITSDNAQIDSNIAIVRNSVAAYVDSVCFRDNAVVKKGQILFILDSTDLRLKADEASAALHIAESRLEAAGNKAAASEQNAMAGDYTVDSYRQGVSGAKANLEKAQNNFDRVSSLMDIKAVTKDQFESAGAALTVAKSEYNRAVSLQRSFSSSFLGLQSMARSDEIQVNLARGQVDQCRADLKLALHQLSYTVIRAPFDGIVSKRAVQAGQYVSAGQSLCSVVGTGDLWVTANFKETQLKDLRQGQHVVIHVDAYPDLRLCGRIESFTGATGARFSLLPPDNATGNFIKITQRVPVKIVFNDTVKLSKYDLLPGMSLFVKVRVD